MQLMFVVILTIIWVLGIIIGFSYINKKKPSGFKLWITIFMIIIFVVITFISIFYIIASFLLIGGID